MVSRGGQRIRMAYRATSGHASDGWLAGSRLRCEPSRVAVAVVGSGNNVGASGSKSERGRAGWWVGQVARWLAGWQGNNRPAGGPLVALAGWWVVVVGWPAGGPLEGNVRPKKSPAVAGW